MPWATPQYARAEVDAAGRMLVNPDAWPQDTEHAFAVISNWRSSHSFPLNTIQIGLRAKCKHVQRRFTIGQRIKRLSSIRLKLTRFPTMNLSRMQDIGGCRAVVSSVREVDELAELHRVSRMRHTPDRSDDYIRNPKESGYRGIHLVYRYSSDRNETYNGLRVEVQLRSEVQHAWATAVETAGTFTQQSLKSSLGEATWLRFFALMGTALALREETPLVPGTPTDEVSLRSELQDLASRLDVANRLNAYGSALKAVEQGALKRAHYFLLELDPVARQVRIQGYRSSELDLASDDYLKLERSVAATGSDAVLVSVESLVALRRAYPNYFLDTNAFISAVDDALGSPRKSKGHG